MEKHKTNVMAEPAFGFLPLFSLLLLLLTQLLHLLSQRASLPAPSTPTTIDGGGSGGGSTQGETWPLLGDDSSCSISCQDCLTVVENVARLALLTRIFRGHYYLSQQLPLKQQRQQYLSNRTGPTMRELTGCCNWNNFACRLPETQNRQL